MKKELIICNTEEQFSLAKKITKDYMNWLGADLYTAGIENEMSVFSKMYNKPTGCFIYLLINNKIAGGVGARYLDNGICEMKRLFVYDEFRGEKLGSFLCEKLIKTCKSLGYHKMRLDTLPSLTNAVQLYDFLGFYEIPPYHNHPDERVVYYEIIL